MTAWLNGFMGATLLAAIGKGVLGWSTAEVLHALLGSCLGGTISLFGVLKAERVPWVRQRLLGRPLKVWFFFVSSFFGQVLAYVPHLRFWDHPRAFLLQLIPIMLCNGFTIVLFGPIQDRIVWRRQRRERPPEKAVGAGRPDMVKAK
jgi:hypothetical protein